MVTRFSVLAIMPLDFVRGKMVKSGFSDCWKEILFGMFDGQTKRTRFAFVNAIITSYI